MDLSEKVQELLRLECAREQLEDVFDTMLEEHSPEKRDAAQSVKVDLVDAMMSRLADTYNEHLPEDVVDAAIAFYSSPMGAKLTRLQTEMGSRMTVIVRKALEDFDNQIAG